MWKYGIELGTSRFIHVVKVIIIRWVLALDCPLPKDNQEMANQPVPNLTAVEGGRRVRWATFVQSRESMATMYEQIIPFLEVAFVASKNGGTPESLLVLDKNHQDMVANVAEFFFIMVKPLKVQITDLKILGLTKCVRRPNTLCC